eukprot:8084812-Alexandrium_andersonii.AAC.1
MDLAPWIRSGAPLGALRPVTPRGVFPTIAESAPATERDIEGVAANPEGWGNYLRRRRLRRLRRHPRGNGQPWLGGPL